MEKACQERRQKGWFRSLTHLWLSAMIFVVALSGLAGESQAQSIGQLQAELRQIRQELTAMQRSGSSGGAASMAGLTVRMSDLEKQMRTMTGQIERVSFVVNTLEKRLDQLSEDIDYRLRYLEEKEDQRAAAGDVDQSSGESSEAPPRASQSGILGTLPVQPGQDPQNVGTAGVLPPGDARSQYNYAFNLLKRQDYGRATQALAAFLAAHGEHELAPSANFWLGEAYYGRNDFANAAKIFGSGFQKYSTSDRAPDMLWKLGRSLAAIGQNDKACETFSLLEDQFPNIPNNLRAQVERSKNSSKCGR